MGPRMLQLAVSSVLLRRLVASSGGADPAGTHGIACSNALLELKEDSVKTLVLKSKLVCISRRMLKLKSRLIDISKNILALIDDEAFRLFDHSRLPAYIEALHKRFFDALQESKLHPSLDESSETRILSMSFKSFKELCDGRYDTRVLFYKNKMKKYNAERKNLKSRIAGEERRHRNYFSDGEKASRSLEKLETHKHSLKECEKKCSEYSFKLQTQEDCYGKLMSLSPKVLGDGSVSALHASCLVVDRCLAKKEREYAGLCKRVPSSEDVETTSSTLEPDYQGCMVCFGSFEPGEEKISCANGHELHEKCLYKWCVLGNETCPTCRRAFNEDQQLRLARYGKKYRDHLCGSLYSDPGLDRKYVFDGEQAESNLLESMCEAIRKCVSSLQNHPSYPAVFSGQEGSVYCRFYIPQKTMCYFENTETGHHDPRSKGFVKHRAILIGFVSEYANKSRDTTLDRHIIQPIDSLLNTFYVVDSLLEYLYTELRQTRDFAAKRLAIANGPQTYPALHSLLSRYPSHSLHQIYEKLISAVWSNGPTFKIYPEHWLLKASEMFSEIVSEV